LKIKYCSKCVLPDTRPQINFNYNTLTCDACINTVNKKKIDWSERKQLFASLVKNVKHQKKTYDCIIPVSGGKDSTWQVIVALEYGLHPLCVTWKTPARNNLGDENLQNLIQLGVDHIDFSINPKVEKIFTLKTFEKLGSPVIPMHMALHAIPLQLATKLKIPLILWGENSADEYGGEENLKGLRLNHDWLLKYGVTNGTSYSDWIDEELSEQDLAPYVWPSDEEQNQTKVKAVFLGHYFKWDPQNTFEVAKKFGFKCAKKAKTGYYSFADIDDDFLITIHHWMKWYKFGFTRIWDNLSLEIRNKRMTREEAIFKIKSAGEELPKSEISLFCKYVNISELRFFEIADSFRNKNIWESDAQGNWYIKEFLIKDWKWVQ
jgi:N-acetyl sugar amidotransferase